MFCNNCGAQLPEESKFCHECGNRISLNPSVQTTELRELNYYQTIEEAVKGSETYIPMIKGSIKASQKALTENEKLIYALNCNLSETEDMGKLKVDPMKSKNKINGIFCVTDKRVFFCNSVLGQRFYKEIKLQDITSVEEKSLAIAFSFGTKVRISGMTVSFTIDVKKENATELIAIFSKIR